MSDCHHVGGCGCNLADCCVQCPLPVCQYEEVFARNADRDAAIRRDVKLGIPMHILTVRYGLSKRRIWGIAPAARLWPILPPRQKKNGASTSPRDETFHYKLVLLYVWGWRTECIAQAADIDRSAIYHHLDRQCRCDVSHPSIPRRYRERVK